MLVRPGDEGGRLAAAEQDVQLQARHSVINVAPATPGLRRHFVTLTGCRFLPCPGNRQPGGSGVTTPKHGTHDWKTRLSRRKDLLHPEHGAAAEDAVAADGEPAKDEGLSRIMRAAGAPR